MKINLDQYAPPMPGGDFILQSHKGPIKLSDFRGKVVLIYFGYTYCPDICPTALALTSSALKELNESELAQIQTLFISVDPERDTPERLDEYTHFGHHRNKN
jgi:protein SCO1/2